MVRLIPNISIPSLGYAMPAGGKMSLHVDPSSLIYSHFEHVSGVAAPEGTQGVAISKLNLLDVLIGQLNSIKKGNSAASQILADAKNVDTKNVDSLIESYNNQIRQAKSSGAAKPYTPSPGAQSGVLFSLFA